MSKDKVLIYLGLRPDPEVPHQVRLPWWAWFLIGVALAAIWGAILHY